MADVTDETFQTEVVERSQKVPVVVDLWAPWCGPCKTLSPIIESSVAATGGRVELVKINVDENPRASQTFQVQGIPAVFAIVDGNVVDSFVGAQGQAAVDEFINGLIPSEEEDELTALIAAGDEASLLKALELDPDNEAATTALAGVLIEAGRGEEALAILQRIPETAEIRHLAALARTGGLAADDVESRLLALLDQVKFDDDARREFVDLLDVLGPDDPRSADYRKQLTSRLY
jgi:putative thioredoxin